LNASNLSHATPEVYPMPSVLRILTLLKNTGGLGCHIRRYKGTQTPAKWGVWHCTDAGDSVAAHVSNSFRSAPLPSNARGHPFVEHEDKHSLGCGWILKLSPAFASVRLVCSSLPRHPECHTVFARKTACCAATRRHRPRPSTRYFAQQSGPE